VDEGETLKVKEISLEKLNVITRIFEQPSAANQLILVCDAFVRSGPIFPLREIKSAPESADAVQEDSGSSDWIKR
jgi:hypothetical protein